MKSSPYNEDALQELYRVIAKLQTLAEVERFFKDLCTPAELQALSDRWRVVAPILQGVPYRQIHLDTGVSVTTVGRVARTLTYGEGGYQIALKQVEDKSYD